MKKLKESNLRQLKFTKRGYSPFFYIIIKAIDVKKFGLYIVTIATGSLIMLSCGRGADEQTTTEVEEEIVVDAEEKPTAGGLGGLFGDIMKEVTDSMQSGVDQMVQGMSQIADSIQVAVDSANAHMNKGVEGINATPEEENK